MHYHPAAVENAALATWGAGTLVSLGSDLLAWIDYPLVTQDLGIGSVASHGATVGFIGLATLVANGVFNNLRMARAERLAVLAEAKAARDHDTDVLVLRVELQRTKDDLRKAKRVVKRLNNRVTENSEALNVNIPTIRRTADAVGLVDSPVANPIAIPTPKSKLGS